MARRIEVQIVGDASSLRKAFGQAAGSSRSFGSSLGRVAKFGALAAGGAGLGGLALVLKQGIGEFAEAAKVSAQTGAVLKSTGGAAKVTAGQVSELAAALMRKSGVDDELIQSGENVLLTFTRIRNEAGKGNDIFNQATKATLDLSTALGMDMKSAAILTGKALNDPIKGMTALTRSGIQFTDAQKESIKAMVESGDVMGAQKLILGELNTQFGGSAEALGKTLPGQINVLKQSFNNLAGEVVASLVPAFTKVLDWTTAHWPQIERTIKAVFAGISATIGTAVRFIQAHWDTITRVSTQTWARVRAVAEQAADWYRGTLQPTISSVINTLRAIWERFGGDITRIAQTAFNTLTAVVRNALNIVKGIIEGVLALLRGDWSKAWESLKLVVSNVLSGIGTLVRGFASIALTAAAAIGRAIIDGILAGLGGLWNALKSKLESTLRGVLSSLNPFSPVSHGAEIHIGRPLAEGAIRGWVLGSAALPEAMKEGVRKAVEAARQQVESSRGVLSSAFSALSGDALAAFDAIAGQAQTKSEKLLARLRSERDAAARASAVSDAQGALASAMAGTDGVVDPEAVKAAQKQLDDALWAQREFALGQRIEQERRELNARIEVRRRKFEEQLAQLAAAMQREGATAAGATRAVLKLLGKFGVNFREVGEAMGQAWIAGLKETIASAARGAGALAGTISKAAGGIKVEGRAGGGSVIGGRPYLVGERGPELMVPGRSGTVVANGALGGGGASVVVNVYGDVTGEELVEKVRRGLLRVGGRNVSVGLA